MWGMFGFGRREQGIPATPSGVRERGKEYQKHRNIALRRGKKRQGSTRQIEEEADNALNGLSEAFGRGTRLLEPTILFATADLY